MIRRQLPVLILMLLALGGALLVAACGGDSTEPEPTIATGTPPQPTPSPPLGTPPAIDTSGWLTYANGFGLEIKYPPTWIVREWPDSPGFAKIRNEARQETAGPVGSERLVGVANAGDGWIEITPDAFPEYDPEGISQSCRGFPGRVDPYSTTAALETDFAGYRAVSCIREAAVSPLDPLGGRTEAYYIEFPSGRVLSVKAYAVGSDPAVMTMLRAVLDTVTLTTPP